MLKQESTRESLIEVLYRQIIPDYTDDYSPLDRHIVVSEFDSLSGSTCYQRKSTLNELAEEIKNTSAKRKDRLPLIKLAPFGGKRSESGSLRHNANMLGISGVELDYDGEEISPREARTRLRKAGIAALVYTSPSHTSEAPRWRVLAPCSRNLPTSARKKLVARINGLFDGAIDPASFTDSQSFYMGSVRGSSPVETYLVDGDYIDRADHLDRCAIGPRERETERTKNPANDNFDLPNLDDAARYLNATSRHLVDDRDFYLTAIFAFADAFGDEAREAVEDWAKQSEKYRRRDFARDWESAFRPYDGERAGLASIIDAARGEYALTDFEVRELFEEDEDDIPIEPRKPKARLEWFGDISPALDSTYLIKGLIDAGTFSVMWGNPKAGKTFAALDMAYHLAAGKSWRGRRTRKAAVLYLALEGGSRIKNRIVALQNEFGGDDLPFALRRAGLDLLNKNSGDVRRIIDLHREVKTASGDLPTVIVVDTLSRALAGGDESSSVDMTAFVRNVDAIREQTGAHVMVIHHAGKDVSRGMRGHSSLMGAIDHELFVEHDEKTEIRTLRVGVQRDSDTSGMEFAYRLRSVEVGTDQDGDAVASAVCVPVISDEVEELRQPLAPQEQKALDVLKSIADDGRALFSDWQKSCVTLGALSMSEDQESRQRAFRRARDGLVREDRIRVRGDRAIIIENRVRLDPEEFDYD